MFQEKYQKAMRFAAEKHSNQKYPGSEANYMLHIANVTMEIIAAYAQNKNFDIELAVQVAALHDTIEDTDTTYEELLKIFGEKIADAVSALSKNEKLNSKAEQMQDSLARINKLEKETGMVKLVDRITNLQEPPAYWDKEKIKKYYEEAKVISENLKDKNDYLNKRLNLKIEDYKRFFEEYF